MLATTTSAAFDALPAERARELLAPCCASRRWSDALVARRPFGTSGALLAASDDVLAELHWDDVLEALAAHPRIGQRAEGNGLEASWSRAEQARAATAGRDTAAAIRAGNLAYEHRFGWVFLIRAAGREPDEVLAALTRRLEHDPATEQAEVREQLAQIVRLRLARTVGDAS